MHFSEFSLKTITTQFRALRHCDTGNVGMIFALLAIPLLALAGGSVDYSRATKARSTLQQVCDSAVLASSRVAGGTQSQFEDVAQNYVTNNAPPPYNTLTPLVDVDPDGTWLKVSLSTTVPTTTLPLLNIHELPVAVDCKVSGRKLDPMEVVMVLDYSSSMNGSAGNGQAKWEAMKTAAIGLAVQLRDFSDPDTIKLGLVPFDRYVRMTVPGENLRGTATGDITTCVKDRDYPHNLVDTTPSGSDNDPTKWPRFDDSHCDNNAANSMKVLPLTTDINAAIAQLNAMEPVSGTNIQLGLGIGQHVISPNEPFAQGASYNDPDMPKILILLTDGEQTVSGNGPNGTSSNDQAKANIETICENVKGNGVTVITIAYDIGSQNTRDRLKNCATSEDHYFEPYNGEQLFTAFSGIAAVLGQSAFLSE